MKILHGCYTRGNLGDVFSGVAIRRFLQESIPGLRYEVAPPFVLSSNYDVYVLGGGGLYSVTWPADVVRGPVVLYGVGVNINFQDPLSVSREQVDDIVRLNRSAISVSCRDSLTRKWLWKWGLVRKIYVVGCPSVFLTASREKVAELLSKKNILWVGISVCGGGRRMCKWVDLQRIGRILRDTLDTSRFRCFFLSHGDDKRFRDEVAPFAEWIYESDPATLFAYYSAMDVVVADRHHSVYWCAANGTPIVPLMYNWKCIGALDLLWGSRYRKSFEFDIFSCTTTALSMALERVLSSRAEVLVGVSERLSELRKEHSLFLRETVGLLSLHK